MALSRTFNTEIAAKYAIAASKGFSYYLPKSAQQHLRELLEQLPSTTRAIYNEHYRDLMCAKACAPESAVAIARFVDAFPVIAGKHNAFAREINKEIDSNEHEGYEPVKFPEVDESGVDIGKGEVMTSRSKKRKRAPAKITTSPFWKAAPNKKAKTEQYAQPDLTLNSAITAPHSPSPTSVPNQDLLPSPHPSPDHTGYTFNNTSQSNVLDQLHPTLDSDKVIDVEIGASSDCGHFGRQSGNSSSPSDAPPSESLHGKSEAIYKLPTHNGDIHNHQRSGNAGHHTVSGEEETRDSDTHDAVMQSPGWSTIEDGFDNEFVFEPDHGLLSEDQRWKDGLKAIEDFQWDGKGSRRESGRDLLSCHGESVGRFAGLFKGTYWDDVGTEDLFSGLDQASSISDDEHVVDAE